MLNGPSRAGMAALITCLDMQRAHTNERLRQVATVLQVMVGTDTDLTEFQRGQLAYCGLEVLYLIQATDEPSTPGTATHNTEGEIAI